MAPFHFNIAAWSILPIMVVKAPTAEAQIDLIYEVADDPATPKARAIALLTLAEKMMNKMKAARALVDRMEKWVE